MKLCSTLKQIQGKNWKKDIVAGMIIAAVSIPIAMGYAQIAGLPAVYGLYGSVLPIIVFAVFSTSPSRIFGVDAAPAALTGGALVSLGIVSGSPQAGAVVPVITFFVAVWLLFFSIFKFGSFVKYISESVMGGFITGIGVTIIVMQVPKLMGGTAGHGEIVELIVHAAGQWASFNGPSLILGLGTLAVILTGRRVAPKIPFAVIVMGLGALAQALFHLDQYGVALLPAVSPGLPGFSLPRFSQVTEWASVITTSLTIALVVMAETLLSSNNMAARKGQALNDNQEILAYAMGNFVAAATGCCPVNGSVSRMGMADQFDSQSQLTGVVAGLVMIVVLLFGTGFIAYLPVPVLTAIVIAALCGILEFDEARRLFKMDLREFYIFLGAFAGVLFLGTLYGVVIGAVLSFGSVLIRSVSPPRDVLGVIRGSQGFYSLKRYPKAYPILHVVIYRFSANLFFANIDVFEEDLKKCMDADTRVVIVDASGITSLDLTAAKHIDCLYRRMKSRGIAFYLAEHIAEINDALRKAGYGYIIEDGGVSRTIAGALRAAGMSRPFTLKGEEWQRPELGSFRKQQLQNDLAWAFGDDQDAEMEKHIQQWVAQTNPEHSLDLELERYLHEGGLWGRLSRIEEDELLERLETHLPELARKMGKREKDIGAAILRYRRQIARDLETQNPEMFQLLVKHRKELRRLLEEKRKNRNEQDLT